MYNNYKNTNHAYIWKYVTLIVNFDQTPLQLYTIIFKLNSLKMRGIFYWHTKLHTPYAIGS